MSCVVGTCSAHIFKEDESDEESEDETAEALTERVEIDFFKTLAFLKAKNPAIYDKNAVFFKDEEEDDTEPAKDKKAPKAKPVYLKDHERNRLLTKGADAFVSDEEGSPTQSFTPCRPLQQAHPPQRRRWRT